MFNEMQVNSGGGGGTATVFTPITFTATTSWTTKELGFQPKHVIFYGRTSSSKNGFSTLWYDVDNNTLKCTYDTTWEENYADWINVYMQVDGTQFKFKAPNSAWATTIRLFAY